MKFFKRSMKISSLCFYVLFTFQSISVMAEDGTFDATVTTESGSYSVPVEVEDGQVAYVDWPNGGRMTVDGADLESGEADGTNSRGDFVHIELDDPQDADDGESYQLDE